MSAYEMPLRQISHRAPHILDLLARLIEINSKTGNRDGLDRVISLLRSSFSNLGGEMELLDVGFEKVIGTKGKETNRPLGQALRIVKRPESQLQIFLCGHMDTVLEPGDFTRLTDMAEDGKLWGPGAVDGKGGLAVMLAALECLEDSPLAESMGWEVLIVPDEEIGSPGSEPLLKEAAKRCQLGLLFEPALPDGALVGARSGSGNFVAIIRGRAAHAGREPESGRNAIDAMADFIVSLRELGKQGRKILVNVGAVEGGGPVNVVPDFALCRFNIRVSTLEELEAAQNGINGVVKKIGSADGISVELIGSFRRPPKLLDSPTRYLLESLAACGRDLDLDIRWNTTGGVCDGNTLAEAGLPNVDSLGPVGSGMHTPQEYVFAESITERARLVALFLMRLASKEIPWPGRSA